MTKNRLEAFSDGVIAIIITVMILELKIPRGSDLEALSAVLPAFLSYVLSFVFTAIYWNNHHHMMTLVSHVNGRILWANIHLLFWLSLVPFTTAWMGENHFAALPTAVYGIDLLLCGVAYYTLQQIIIASQGTHSLLRRAVGADLKGKISPIIYLASIVCAFIDPRISDALFVVVAIMWLVPDPRIEHALKPEIEFEK